MHDRSGKLSIIDFEITHRCNKRCRLCDHRCPTSDYEMSLDDYNHVSERVGNRSSIGVVLVIGGEPLTHPDYREFISCIRRDFPQAAITVQTNGRLLPWHYDPSIRWVVTHYPGWNDSECDLFEEKENVIIARSGGMFWNPFTDPNLSEKDARKARELCTYSVRILGRRLYSCCLSEPVERDYELDGVSIPFTAKWRDEIYTIETWRACAHCFRAGHLINDGVLYPVRTERHNG